MLKEEFIARTGFTPTDAEYAAIEEDYYEFDGDKDAYCKAFDVEAFKEDQEVREIAEMRRENERMKSEIEALRTQVERMEKENVELKFALEKEQKWELSEGAGTNMDQDAYEALARSDREMTDEEAREWIHDELGYDTALIEILHEASTMEVSRHNRLRKGETFTRRSVYESSDWNYVRFDVKSKCGTWSWEIVNGTPYEYME